ncbi:MAG: sigma factor-like helix-turn-helix DNA-binding protein [Solirubrobacteraceae bacterium]
MQAALASIPEAQEEVIVLSFYGQLSHTEIGAQLGLPPGTVKGRMRPGLQKLHLSIEQARA